jgi:hypothetical protein
MSTFAAYKSKILSELLRCAPHGFNSRFVVIFVPKLRVISSPFAHGLLSHRCCGNWFRASNGIKYLKNWAEKILTLDGFQVETSEFSSVHNFSFTVSVWICWKLGRTCNRSDQIPGYQIAFGGFYLNSPTAAVYYSDFYAPTADTR